MPIFLCMDVCVCVGAWNLVVCTLIMEEIVGLCVVVCMIQRLLHEFFLFDFDFLMLKYHD